MLETVRDGVPLVALLVLLAVAYLHPPEWVEAAVAVGCGGAALATGSTSTARGRRPRALLASPVAIVLGVVVPDLWEHAV